MAAIKTINFKPVACPECTAIGIKRIFARATGLGSHRRSVHHIIGTSVSTLHSRTARIAQGLSLKPLPPLPQEPAIPSEALPLFEEQHQSDPEDQVSSDDLPNELLNDLPNTPLKTRSHKDPLYLRVLNKINGETKRSLIRKCFGKQEAVDVTVLIDSWKSKGLISSRLDHTTRGRASEMIQRTGDQPIEEFMPEPNSLLHKPHVKGQKTFKCPHCSELFAGQRWLSRHINTTHAQAALNASTKPKPTPSTAIQTNGHHAVQETEHGNSFSPNGVQAEQTFTFSATEVTLDRASCFAAGLAQGYISSFASSQNLSPSELTVRSMEYLFAYTRR